MRTASRRATGTPWPEVEHQGNFHTAAISPRESLISTGTVMPATWRAVRRARVQWTAPKRLVEDAVSSAAGPNRANRMTRAQRQAQR